MKLKNISTLLALAAFSTINSQLSIARAQGSLTPPAGVPAPVMKSLDQVEARIPLLPGQPGVSASSVGTANVYYTITNSGSYYLTTNLSALIGTSVTIQANNVTLDLNGFNINGNQSVSVFGIKLNDSRTNIVIRNGSILNCGYNGIEAYSGSSDSQNVIIEDICVSGCGNNYLGTKAGIAASEGSVVRRCSASGNKGNGISSAGVVTDCTAIANTVHGFYMSGGRVEGCTALQNAASGIQVIGANAVVINNVCTGNNIANLSSYAGIYIFSTANSAHVEHNRIASDGVGLTGYGIYVQGLSCTVIKNFVTGYGADNYGFAGGGGTDLGPIGTAAAATSPFANLSK